MKTFIVAFLGSALVLGGLMAIATPGWADEQLKITGEVKEFKSDDGTRLQIIPTDRGVVIVMGELVKGQPANVVLLEGAQPTQIKVTPHTHTQVITIHQAWEEELARQTPIETTR